MSTNFEDDKEPSWVKENLSQLLLLAAMLMLVVSFAVYLFSSSLSEFIFAVDREPTEKKVVSQVVNKAPEKVITENWHENELGPIENTQYSVGASDLSDKRVVISKEELIGLEQLYRIDLVDREKQPLPAKIENQQPDEAIPANNNQPRISIIEMSESFDAQIDRVNGQAEIVSSVQKNDHQLAGAGQLNEFNSLESLLAKSPSLYTLRLFETETWEKLQAFVQQDNLLNKNIDIYRTIKNNKPYYIVLFGEYSSFSAAKIAQQALSDLPSQVFTYKEIQQDL